MSVTSHTNGWPSDHTLVKYSVEFKDPKGTSTSGPHNIATWNKMNQGFSKQTCKLKPAFSNNPWDLDESINDYAKRMEGQRDYLVKLIDKGSTDIICLQEVNDLINPLKRWKGNADFKKELNKRGWTMVVSDPSTKPLVVLYDSKKYAYVSKRGILPNNNGKNTGLEVQLRHQNKVAAVASIHLDFNKNYSQDLTDYQKQMIQKRIPTILAGDTNRGAGVKNRYKFIGASTNHTHLTMNGITANYDALATSPTVGTRAVVKEMGGVRFVNNATNTATFGPAKWQHESYIGQPWIAKTFRATLLDFNNADVKTALSQHLGVPVSITASNGSVHFTFQNQGDAQKLAQFNPNGNQVTIPQVEIHRLFNQSLYNDPRISKFFN